MKNEKIEVIQKEADELKDLIIEKYNLTPIKLKVKNISRGWAYYDSRYISIPIWAYKYGWEYFYSYVLHEVSHFINYDRGGITGHTNKFKEIEKELLAGYGLIPIYKRAYIKELRNDKGDTLWVKKGYEKK
jgi:predicted SprT family Zn-dependent metalloprotease